MHNSGYAFALLVLSFLPVIILSFIISRAMAIRDVSVWIIVLVCGLVGWLWGMFVSDFLLSAVFPDE